MKVLISVCDGMSLHNCVSLQRQPVQVKQSVKYILSILPSTRYPLPVQVKQSVKYILCILPSTRYPLPVKSTYSEIGSISTLLKILNTNCLVSSAMLPLWHIINASCVF